MLHGWPWRLWPACGYYGGANFAAPRRFRKLRHAFGCLSRYLLSHSSFKASEMTETLVEAFEKTNAYICVHFSAFSEAFSSDFKDIANKDGWSVDTSGCTAVLALWKDKKAHGVELSGAPFKLFSQGFDGFWAVYGSF